MSKATRTKGVTVTVDEVYCHTFTAFMSNATYFTTVAVTYFTTQCAVKAFKVYEQRTTLKRGPFARNSTQ